MGKTEKCVKRLLEIQERFVKINQISHVLRNDLTLGWRAHLVAQRIRQTWKNDPDHTRTDLLLTIHHSCRDRAILSLSSVVSEDRTRQSVNIGFLLREFEAATSALAKLLKKCWKSQIIGKLSESVDYDNTFFKQILAIPTDEVLTSLKQDLPQLIEIRLATSDMIDRRNKRIAHIDKKQVNDPTAVFELGMLDEKETERVFRQIFSMVDKYAFSYLSPHLSPPNPNGQVSKELDYLITQVDNSRS